LLYACIVEALYMPLPDDPHPDMQPIGRRIHQARLEMGYSQQEAASAMAEMGAEISQGTWSSVESGRNRGKKYRGAIARVLGVRLEWLLHGEEPMRPGVGPPARRVAEPAVDDQSSIGHLLYQMAGDLRQLRDDCHELRQRMARLEAGAGATDYHQSETA
jgi:transcriptional regulator with XRE-family HTH domain